MVNATSKVPLNFATLKFGDFGNFRQCINSKTNTFHEGDVVGKYCFGFIFNRNSVFQHEFFDLFFNVIVRLLIHHPPDHHIGRYVYQMAVTQETLISLGIKY